MNNYIILNNTSTLILSLAALLLLIFSFVAVNKKIATLMQVISFLCVLATVVYGLLLGAELTEILVYVLIFVVIGLISFLPKIDDSQSENKPLKDKKVEETQIKDNIKATENLTDLSKKSENRENNNEF